MINRFITNRRAPMLKIPFSHFHLYEETWENLTRVEKGCELEAHCGYGHKDHRMTYLDTKQNFEKRCGLTSSSAAHLKQDMLRPAKQARVILKAASRGKKMCSGNGRRGQGGKQQKLRDWLNRQLHRFDPAASWRAPSADVELRCLRAASRLNVRR